MKNIKKGSKYRQILRGCLEPFFVVGKFISRIFLAGNKFPDYMC
jgi:hypothetical protein